MDEAFYIVSAPERSLSGNAINELRDLPQIIGGSEISIKMATRVFDDVGIEVIGLPSYEASELVKSFSNFARLVQFNLSNYSTKTTVDPKIQEQSSSLLIECAITVFMKVRLKIFFPLM